MKYLEWNNIIASYFFNPSNAGKEIYLYLTKKDIIKLSRGYFVNETDNDIWLDFISSIKRGIPGSNGNVIDKAKYAYTKNNLVGLKKSDGSYATIDNVPVLYPPYISYLSFFILPLIEDISTSNQRANNYYGRLNSFLKGFEINETLGTDNFRDNQINFLWEDLANWANVKNNGDLGLFNLVPFSNKHWIYVGKVFSQCILPPKILNRLPKFFEDLGLVPDISYEDKYLQEIIKNSKTDLIPKSTLDFLKKDDELSNSIIQIIKRQYKKWSGETHEEIDEGTFTKKKRNYTVASLFLQLKVDINNEAISFSYRMYSSNDYPEDLKFGKHENLYEINGWSKTLLYEFNEHIELKDDFNKWIAKSPNRDVRIFINAGILQLSNIFWIEINFLSKTEPMYLLCKNQKKELINAWGKTFSNENFRQVNFDGVPQNYSLYWFRNPTQGCSEIELLKLYNEKRIELIGGLKVNFRTYLNDFLPEVEILNSSGNEKVYLQYKGIIDKIFLSKKNSIDNRWLLPEKTAIDTDFYIKIDNENTLGNLLAYSLVSSDNSARKVHGANLPKRDSFGNIVLDQKDQYCLGSNIVNPNILRQVPYEHMFRSNNIDTVKQFHEAIITNHNGNRFCNFLSLKSELTTEEFFKAFEFFYLQEFPDHEKNSEYNLTKLKRASLNFYDYIGVLDYDYETKRIVLNSPQLTYIPALKGRKILLIGARDLSLIEALINTAKKYNLQVEITKQYSANERLLLPDIITVKSFYQSDDNYGEKKLISFAKDLQIKFTPDYFPQVALQDFSSTIIEYENTLQQSNENDYDWARYIFNPSTLNFDKCETLNFDKSFSLVKYKLNEYTYQFKLWKENKCYHVDMNWGRYIALKHFQKQVILFDNISKKVAIPVPTPLPRLLSEAIMLLSGKAPDFGEIDGIKYRVYENVIGIFTQNLFKLKLGQTAIISEL